MANSLFENAIYLDDVPKNQWKNYFGDGYRSVCYLVDSNRMGKIVLFGFDKQGNRQTYVCPHESWIKYCVKYDTPEKDIYDRNVETRKFNNVFERKRYVENANGLTIVECMKPEQEFLHEMFDDVVLDPSFNKQKLRTHYIDIETEISETFERPSTARNRINMITIYDTETEKYYTWSLSHAEIDFKEDPLNTMSKDKFVFYEFNDQEDDMLEHFISWIEDNYPDVSYGWNTQAYDWPYIIRRIENVLGKGAAGRISPVGKYRIKEVNHENTRTNAEADIEVNIEGLFIADGLILYRNKFFVRAQLDGGYSLDNVGEAEGLGHKIKYNGTLKDLYLKDYQKFYEYNVRDVDLVRRIEEKCKLTQISRTVTMHGLTNYNAIYTSISYLIGSVTAFAKTHMKRVFTSYLAKRDEKSKPFQGAFVFPTVKGFYKGGIATIDFASLYPSNIQAINASPETYCGKVHIYKKNTTGEIYEYDDQLDFNATDIDHMVLELPNKKRKPITVDQIQQLKQTKCIFTANNTLFLKHEIKWGVVSAWCKHFYALRKSTKKKELAIFHQLHNAEEVAKLSQSEIDNLEMQMGNYHDAQQAIKMMINSIYGCMGTAFSPIYNQDVAQSVTRQGRFCNISTSKHLRDIFKKEFGIDDNYPFVISGDTDSQFINCQCVSDHMREKYKLPKHLIEWSEEKKRELWDYMEKLTEEDLNPFVRKLVTDYCGTNNAGVLTYELEYMGECGIYEAKKHYCVKKMFEEGDRVDYVKYSGIELKKATLPKEIKTFLKELYENTLLTTNEWTETKFRDFVNELYDKFKQFNINEISMWKGYSAERQATGFLEMQKGSTCVASAATYWNQLLKKFGLGKKYDEILVGQKVRFCYVEPSNPYRINYIAFPAGQWPAEFDEVFRVDYETMFDKLIMSPLKGYMEACGYVGWDPSARSLFDVNDL